jgi:hypothetical protein
MFTGDVDAVSGGGAGGAEWFLLQDRRSRQIRDSKFIFI